MTDSQIKKLDELLEKEEGLFSGEIDLIDNLDNNFRERNLSEKQENWLDRIWDRLCK